MNKAIFFDRDGVLIKAPVVNGIPKSAQSLKDIAFLDDIKDMCLYLKKKNYLLFMVTNQPDYSRRLNTKKNIEEINNYLKDQLSLDDIYVCYCDDDRCPNRKPNPGMLLKIKKKYEIDIKQSFIIGDRWRDIGAGKQANCKTILIEYDYLEKNTYKPDFIIKNLNQIYAIIK